MALPLLQQTTPERLFRVVEVPVTAPPRAATFPDGTGAM